MRSLSQRALLALVASIFFLVGSALAQTTAGIRGTVTDPTGAVIPGAKVIVTNEGTGLTQTAVANAAGVYTLTLLPVGTYDLKAEASGFKAYQRKGITLTTNEVLGLNVTLQLGQVTQTVQVTSAVPLVNTQTTSISTLINSQQIKELPLNGRNVIQLATLTNGVNESSVPVAIQGNDARAMSHLYVNGNQGFMTQFQLDGGEFEDPELNAGLNYPNPDAVQEFRFITSNYSAQYGKNPGGVLSVVTKSGTNQYHGDAWEFNRNSALGARTFFLPTVPFLNQNQFGFTAGGPIVKNKLFAFGSGQWLRIAQGAATSSAFPPTALERKGDFSQDPGNIIDPQTGQQFPGNVIPPDRLDPVAVKYMNLIPLPNNPDGSFRGAFPQPVHNYQWLVKPDYMISPKQRLSGSVFVDRTASTSELDFGRFTLPLVNTTGPSAESNSINVTNVIVDHTYNITPTVLNFARFSYIKTDLSTLAEGRGPTMQDLGASFPTFPLQDVPNISDPSRYFLGTGNFTDTHWHEYEFNDNINYIHGAHSLKFGAVYHRLHFETTGSANDMGVFFGEGTATGNPVADIMLGKTLSYVSNALTTNENQYNFAGYIQDDYKVSRNLVLNLGLRYQIANMFTPQPIFKTPSGDYLRGAVGFNAGQQSQVFKNAPTGLLFQPQPAFGGASDGVPTTIVYTPKHNLAPRVGVAWDVFGNGKTAVRAGWGLFYDTWHVNSLQGAIEGPPFFVNFFQAQTVSLVNAVAPLAGKFPVQYTPNLDFSPFLPLSFEYLDPHMGNADIYQYNFTLQQQLPGQVALQAAYVGSVSRHLVFINNQNPAIYVPGVDSNGNPLSTLANENERRPFNQPFLPTIPYGQVGLDSSRANASYNSLQVQVQKRTGHGVSLLGAYTWSKTLDITDYFITTGNFTGPAQNPFDINAEKGPAGFDRRQIFTASIVYDTPSLSKALNTNNWLAKRITDNWELTSIVSLHTGVPFGVVSGRDNSLTGVNNDRPNLVGDPYLSTSRPRGQLIQQYFNPLAFQQNAKGTFGNEGRNILTGPGYADVDFGIFKNIPITERVRLQLRMETFNLFNRPNLSNPNANLNSLTLIGKITSAGSGRIVQLGGKVTF